MLHLASLLSASAALFIQSFLYRLSCKLDDLLTDIREMSYSRVCPPVQDSFYRGLTPEESDRVHEYNFDHPGRLLKIFISL